MNSSSAWALLGGPQLVGIEQEVQLEEAAGRMVNLSCEAQGHPLPSISWNIIGSQVSGLTHSMNLSTHLQVLVYREADFVVV